ncbi:ADP-ribosylglycohydrolase family protein [Desulfococcaceae bacterium HSG8]|nr:ADP-ribosylglycohydrolase family protein [Desulfococcaceae bacterium HSG8]
MIPRRRLNSYNMCEQTLNKSESVIGCLLGTAVGDALGLCFENLSKQRQRRMFHDVETYHFFLGKGMVSDDTEHACMLAQALISSAGEPEKFISELSRSFRFWLLGLPAGVGYATLRSLLKLWIGFPGKKSGVFSAGNGPAMRSPLIGVCYGHDPVKMRQLVRASARITHTDPKAEFGALAAALAAYMASRNHHVSAQDYSEALKNLLAKDNAVEFLELINQVIISVENRQTTESFAEEMGLGSGISGYMYHTIPPVIHCWLTHQGDFKGALKAIIRCGGDTDTTGAITGAIIGSSVGSDGIPEAWLENLWEWPRTKSWMIRLGNQLAEVCESGSPQSPPGLPFYSVILRNLMFLIIVLFHGFRRLFPPY